MNPTVSSCTPALQTENQPLEASDGCADGGNDVDFGGGRHDCGGGGGEMKGDRFKGFAVDKCRGDGRGFGGGVDFFLRCGPAVAALHQPGCVAELGSCC